MQQTTEVKELTIKEIILKLREWIQYLASKWLVLLICIVIGIIGGYVYSTFSKVKYTAESIFIFENEGGNSSGLGAVVGLGDNNMNKGLFSSLDNIIWLYKSDDLLTRTLLTPIPDGEHEGTLLVNLFSQISLPLQEKLKKQSKAFHNLIISTTHVEELNPTEIKYLRICIDVIKSDYLKVEKVEKSDNILNVTVVAEHEAFAYYFNKELIQNVNQFYIDTKTKKQKEVVENLQLKVDTLKVAVDKNMYEVASTYDMNPFPNPHLKVLTVEPQKQNIDVQVLSNLYIQATQSLEIAKNELAKVTPIIQTIGEPILPLKSSKFGMKTGMIMGGLIGFLLPFLFYIPKKVYQDIMREEDTKKGG